MSAIDLNACMKSLRNIGEEFRIKRYSTCLTCPRISFENAFELYKKHYTTEYHRYNLKRKMDNLPVITLEEYEEIKKDNRTDDENDTKNCTLCRKKYNSKNQYKNHLTSTKHKDNMKKSGAEFRPSKSDSSSDSESYLNIPHYVKEEEKGMETDSEEIDRPHSWNLIIYDYCLFCSHRSKTIDDLLVHMKQKHSFFIPYEKNVICRKRLLLHLSTKIWDDYKCLWCNNSGKQLRSAQAARSHMIDKGHCKMLFEGEALLEYMPFYIKYPSNSPYTYCPTLEKKLPDPDDEGNEIKLRSYKMISYSDWANPETARKLHDLDKRIYKLRFKGNSSLMREYYYWNYNDAYNYYMSNYPDANWSDSDEELSVPNEKLSDPDEKLPDSKVLDDKGIVYEMKLPSGKVIGHRSLIRYKQYVKGPGFKQ